MAIRARSTRSPRVRGAKYLSPSRTRRARLSGSLSTTPPSMQRNLYGPEKLSALVEVRSGTYRPDLLRVQADGPPGLGRRVAQGLVIQVHTVGPVMRAQVMPQVLHRVQLGRVRQQPDQAHVRRHHQAPAGVVARVVPQQDAMGPGGQPPGELLQEQV